MTGQSPPPEDELFILVPDEQWDQSSAEPEPGLDEHGPAAWFRERTVERRKVDLSSVRTELGRLQNQARQLLETLSPTKVGDMRLDEVEFSIGLNAQGSLGIVTAGVEVAIALTYRRVDSA